MATLEYVPLLREQRSIYDHPLGMERFRTYLELMTQGTGDMVLPLAGLNPMGKPHVAQALDALLAIDADTIAADAMREAEDRLGPWPTAVLVGGPDRDEPGAEPSTSLRVALVLLDERGGWSNRPLDEVNALRGSVAPLLKRRWLPAYHQATDDHLPDRVRADVLAEVYRFRALTTFGPPANLRGMMVLHGLAQTFAGAIAPCLDSDELEYTWQVIAPFLDADAQGDFPTIVACLQGDDAARIAGYSPLGLSARAGLALALSRARTSGFPPERVFQSHDGPRQAESAWMRSE